MGYALCHQIHTASYPSNPLLIIIFNFTYQEKGSRLAMINSLNTTANNIFEEESSFVIYQNT